MRKEACQEEGEKERGKGRKRKKGLSPKSHGHHFLSLLCPSNVETQSWSPFLCLASTPSPYVSLDLAGLTFFRPLLFSHLYTGLSPGISVRNVKVNWIHCRFSVFEPAWVCSSFALEGPYLCLTGDVLRHIATPWEVLRVVQGFLLQQELIQKSLGIFGSTLILKCQDSVGIFSSVLEIELISLYTQLVSPNLSFLFKFHCSFQNRHFLNVSCLCLSQWNACLHSQCWSS